MIKDWLIKCRKFLRQSSDKRHDTSTHQIRRLKGC